MILNKGHKIINAEKLNDFLKIILPNYIDTFTRNFLAYKIAEHEDEFINELRPESNHNAMCGINDNDCYICKNKTDSYSAYPGEWAILLPHIDGQTKHRWYHIKCFYPLMISVHKLPIKAEIDKVITDSSFFKKYVGAGLTQYQDRIMLVQDILALLEEKK